MFTAIDLIRAFRLAERGRSNTPQRIADEIEALSAPEQLRLAAELLEERKPKLALAIMRRLSTEFGALDALGKLDEPRGAA